jgi:CheY-like chemotaxis protein
MSEQSRSSAADEHSRRILLLGRYKDNIRTDHKCLRNTLGDIPHEVVTLHRGRDALRHALHTRIDLVLCDEVLDDMQGGEAIRLLRLHPDLQATPMLLFSWDNRRENVLRALASGCSAYVLRPYSLECFREKVEKALAGALDRIARPETPSLPAFQEELARLDQVKREQAGEGKEGPVEAALRGGVAALEAGDFVRAQDWFQSALELDPERGEAHHGLARCWIMAGHPALAKEHFRKAIRTFMEQGRFAKARTVFEELRRRDPRAEDPIRGALALNLRNNDLEATAGLLADLHNGMELSPEIVAQVARICYFTDSPMDTARELCTRLEAAGAAASAGSLRARLLDNGPRARPSGYTSVRNAGSRSVEEPVRPLSNLRAILAVAKYTIQAYRRGTASERA